MDDIILTCEFDNSNVKLFFSEPFSLKEFDREMWNFNLIEGCLVYHFIPFVLPNGADCKNIRINDNSIIFTNIDTTRKYEIEKRLEKCWVGIKNLVNNIKIIKGINS